MWSILSDRLLHTLYDLKQHITGPETGLHSFRSKVKGTVLLVDQQWLQKDCPVHVCWSYLGLRSIESCELRQGEIQGEQNWKFV
jgi:hypothetical protein